VWLVALVALLMATFRVIRATPYARRMSAWKETVLRDDGVVEDAAGATVGKLAPGVRIASGSVLVADGNGDAEASVYRGVRMLARGEVASGGHDRWRRGTALRLRDARTLAVMATLTTALAFVARVLG
jgi:hypothetical protein